ncbi:MAG: hypothetical protein ABIJ43_03295 [Candidatus Beckwithbacteria bacterium]|nr:hypothetical protein [Patescibacteria group bacterium]
MVAIVESLSPDRRPMRGGSTLTGSGDLGRKFKISGNGPIRVDCDFNLLLKRFSGDRKKAILAYLSGGVSIGGSTKKDGEDVAWALGQEDASRVGPVGSRYEFKPGESGVVYMADGRPVKVSAVKKDDPSLQVLPEWHRDRGPEEWR